MFPLTNRNVLHLLEIAAVLHICQAGSSLNESSRVNTTDGFLWQPKRVTREKWMACRGIPKDFCERIKAKKQERLKKNTEKFGNYLQDSFSNGSDEDQRMVFTEQQLDMMITETKKTKFTHRMKRTMIDFKKNPYSKWSMPVPYMFDGTHNDSQTARIRAAFQHWENNTCIRFEELPVNAFFKSSHILITKNESLGCESQVGRVGKQQYINLVSGWCVGTFGAILHEIGHSLGLQHEQSRIDRNDSVMILWDNIKNSAWHNYEQRKTDAHGLPYNYGSIMHYISKNDFSKNGGDTMLALEPLFQMNMGQYADLAFHDRKIINLAYCKGYCATALTQLCQRSGYQNPNNCPTCICPDGFSGQYCDEIAQPQNANCGGILGIKSGTQKVIKSPGYDNRGYSQRQECTWWIKAPENYVLQLSFSGHFSIYCEASACLYHWVEIKYKKDLGLEGPRFCCNDRPRFNVTSESNQMMVIFRSNYIENFAKQKFDPSGFQAIVKSIKVPQVSSSSIPTSNPAAGAAGFLLLSVLLQLRYLPYC